MKEVVLDIETLPLPLAEREFLRPDPAEIRTGNTKDLAKIEAKIAEIMRAFEMGDDAPLSALSGRVALAGLIIDGAEYRAIANADERTLVETLWPILAEADRIIGHNIGFDARFLIRRSFILGVRVPSHLQQDIEGYRPDVWTDTMALWAAGDRQERVSLKHLCGAFGIPVKTGEINGANFHRYWQINRDACIAYNRQDVEATYAIWMRLTGRA